MNLLQRLQSSMPSAPVQEEIREGFLADIPPKMQAIFDTEERRLAELMNASASADQAYAASRDALNDAKFNAIDESTIARLQRMADQAYEAAIRATSAIERQRETITSLRARYVDRRRDEERQAAQSAYDEAARTYAAAFAEFEKSARATEAAWAKMRDTAATTQFQGRRIFELTKAGPDDFTTPWLTRGLATPPPISWSGHDGLVGLLERLHPGQG